MQRYISEISLCVISMRFVMKILNSLTGMSVRLLLIKAKFAAALSSRVRRWYNFNDMRVCFGFNLIKMKRNL